MTTRAKAAAWLVGLLMAGLALWPFIAALESERSAGDVQPRGIRYDLNESGEIRWLTFPPDATDADLAPFRGLRVRQLNVSGTRVTDAGLEALGDLPRLQSLNLSSTPGVTRGLELAARWTSLTEIAAADNVWVDDQQVAALGALQNLQVLNLSGTKITDASAGMYEQLPKLVAIDLRDCAGITDATLARVEALNQLTSVSIERSSVTWRAWSEVRERRRQVFRRMDPLQFAEFRLLREAGGTYSDFQSPMLVVEGDVPAEAFDSLALLPQTRSLHIHSPSLTDDALIPFLENQPELTGLDVAGTQITARAIAVAADECPELTYVDLSGTQIDDAALQLMAPLPNLETLSLDHTQVTSAGIDSVVNQPSLKYLTIEGLALDQEAFSRLHEARPELEILGQRSAGLP